MTFGDPSAAWAAAADVSAETHIRYLDAPVRRVLSLIPAKYDDMWTGAKGFYKVEPVVADGGEVVLYAPHIREIATMHPAINQIGYHCRDYFVKQWDRFKDQHWGDLAHSTHLRGAGTWDEVNGEQRPGHGHPGHRHPRGCHPRGQPRLPRPGGRRPRRVGRRPGHPRRARRRRGPLPAALNPAKQASVADPGDRGHIEGAITHRRSRQRKSAPAATSPGELARRLAPHASDHTEQRSGQGIATGPEILPDVVMNSSARRAPPKA